MTQGPYHSVLLHLRTVLGATGAEHQTDGDLARQFVEFGDEQAFAALVRRHGELVLRVCRRVLRQHSDVDDAFQATFLVLARKAASVKREISLAGWLHG